jgi:hypothetical protein
MDTVCAEPTVLALAVATPALLILTSIVSEEDHTKTRSPNTAPRESTAEAWKAMTAPLATVWLAGVTEMEANVATSLGLLQPVTAAAMLKRDRGNSRFIKVPRRSDVTFCNARAGNGW